MVPGHLPERCLSALTGAAGACRVGGAGWRDRSTGPRHPLRVVRCRVHEIAFTLYPMCHIPYGREPVLGEQGGALEIDTKSSLVGAAVAAIRGERWPEELIFDEQGPVQRTQRRRVKWLGKAVGFDQPQVESSVLGELGLTAVEVNVRSLPQRVSALGRLASDSASWLRFVGALDLVGLLGPVGVMPGVGCGRLGPARGSFARHMRGPPR
jgi:hypothetical protein